MTGTASVFSSGLTFRLLLAGCLAGMLAGCADSERLSDPFSNPFRGDSDRSPTASIGAPTGAVESRPLAAPSQGSYGRPVAAYSAPAYPSQHLASSQSWNGSDTTGSLGQRQSVAGWTAEGGIPIVMAQGETADIIARRYGIPTAALLRTNGFSSSAEVRPGARIIIPTYNAALATSSGVHASADHERMRFVRGPEPADKKLVKSAKAESLAKFAQMKEEKRGKLEAEKSAKVIEKSDRHEAKAEPNRVIAEAEPRVAAPRKPVVDSTPTSSLGPESTKSTNVADTASPEFRWPAHGRIIQAYKSGGNDGINIELPEGTSVRAAEAGVVAYAGNGLKGYGNLVLIRHPNGFVSAYANNGEIDVTRGETVKRGQEIAKSGQSGNVASPQLHFELRKGATPVDPTRYLAGL